MIEGGNSHKWKFCSGVSLSRLNASPRGPEVFATFVTFKPHLKSTTMRDHYRHQGPQTPGITPIQIKQMCSINQYSLNEQTQLASVILFMLSPVYRRLNCQILHEMTFGKQYVSMLSHKEGVFIIMGCNLQIVDATNAWRVHWLLHKAIIK